MVASPITNFQDLKGYSVGIAGFGGASDFAANYIIRKEGLVPGKDVLILSVGGQSERLSALSSGKVKAVLLEPPFTGRAEKLGFRRLVNFPSLDLEFQTMGLVTTRSYLKSDRKSYLDFLKAITEGIYFFKSHKKESTGILASILKTQDRDALEEMYVLYGRYLMPEVPYSSIKGMQNALELLALRNPKAKSKDTMEVVDDSFVKEMEQGGFITYLRKTYSFSEQK
jgi:ABC-type nitrate/sulfonate/bicarbonate transport system substrate-binding protein